MKICLIVISLFISLCGCEKKQEVPDFNFMMFYANWCPTCEAAKSKFIPLLEETFNDSIQITYYDLDTTEGIEMYEYYVGSIDENGNEVDGLLKDVDREFKELQQFPLFIVDDEYGFFNWASIYNENYVEDIKKTFNHEGLDERIYDVIYFFE